MSDRSSPEERSGLPSEVDELAADELPMNLLAAGIPLTLLLDLAENFGPPSTQILESEYDADYHDPSGPAADWLSHLVPAVPDASASDGVEPRASTF